MLMPELKPSQRHPSSPKELGETEIKWRKINIVVPYKDVYRWSYPRVGDVPSNTIF